MLKANRILLYAVAALIVSLSTMVQAAEAPPNMAEMWTMKPKADQRAQFFEALKNHMAFRTEAGDPRVWSTYTPMLGEDIETVAVRSCCIKWADVDAYKKWNEENPEVSKNFYETVGQHVESYGHYYDRISWANSNIKSEWGPFTVFGATKFTLKPGMGGQFDEARDKISQIALNHGWATPDHPWIWSTAVGGVPTESIVVPYSNYADMARDEQTFFDFLAGVMGTDEAAEALFKQMADSVASQEFQIWEYQEDMSMKRPE